MLTLPISSSELNKLLKFMLVGSVSAITHLSVAISIVTWGLQPLYIANLVGFLIAVNISFFGHYHFSFNSSKNKRLAYIKFFTTTLVAALANNGFLAVLYVVIEREITAIVIANAVIPLVTYLMSRVWVFKQE